MNKLHDSIGEPSRLGYGKISTFVPSDLDGLELWLRAGAITAADSDSIQTWEDQSGNGNNATQATESKRPVYKTGIINGKPVLRGDRVDDHYQLDSELIFTGDFSLFFVAEARKDDAWLGRADQVNYVIFPNGTELGLRNNTAIGNIPFTHTDGVIYLVSLIRTSGTIAARKNGVETGTNSHAGTFTFKFVFSRDATLAMQGDMAEIIAYSNAKAGADLASVESRLSSEYGL